MQLTTRHRQTGISLLESLVAIIVMALGILGVIGLQVRNMADNQSGIYRAQAIRLIEELSERITLNPNALHADVTALYLADWSVEEEEEEEEEDEQGEDPPPRPLEGCDTDGCLAASLAEADIARWKATVASILPQGNATVFLASSETDIGNRRHLGVMIGWRANEKGGSVADVLTASAGTGDGAVTCPTGLMCHLQYIPLMQRCSPNTLGGTANAQQLFCAGSFKEGS